MFSHFQTNHISTQQQLLKSYRFIGGAEFPFGKLLLPHCIIGKNCLHKFFFFTRELVVVVVVVVVVVRIAISQLRLFSDFNPTTEGCQGEIGISKN
jgi:hypothetical protein